MAKYKARMRIGAVKPSKGHAGYQARRPGDEFELDPGNPRDKRLIDRLFRHGAIILLDTGDKPSPAPVISEISPPPEVIEDEVYSAVEEGEGGSVLHLDSQISALHLFSENTLDMLRRIGVGKIRDLEKRNDKQLLSVHGIGPSKLGKLREAFDRISAGEKIREPIVEQIFDT